MTSKTIEFELKGWKLWLTLGIVALLFFLWDGLVILATVALLIFGSGILSWFFEIEVRGIIRRRKKSGDQQ